VTARIHPTAIIHSDARLAEDVTVEAYSFIGAGVVIGSGTVLGPYSRIEGPAEIGERNRFFGQCSIGTEAQDLKFKGETTTLTIGSDNTFREFVTVNRGTVGGGGKTTIGANNFFMVQAHVAHDCHVGSHTVFANAATLAGHVEVQDYATVGAFSGVHQFCRVGEHAFLGGFTVTTQDALPFVKTVGNRPAKTYGVNSIGMARKGFSPETIEAIGRAYRILIRSKLKLDEALLRIETELAAVPEALRFARFVREAQRGVVR